MLKPTEYPSNFFRTNEIIHNMAGLWLFNSERISLPRKCIQIFWTVLVYTFAIYFLILEFIIFQETIKDFNKFVSQFGLLLCHCLGIMKVLILVGQHNKLQELANILQDPKYQYEPLQDFNPGKLLTEAKQLSSRFSVTYIQPCAVNINSTWLDILKDELFCLYTFVGVSAHISSEVIINNEVRGNHFEGNTTCYNFMPYYFYIPFSTDTKTKCEYTLIFMDYSLDTYAWFISCHDGFYAALLNCLKTQLIILCEAMRTIRVRVLKKLNLKANLNVFCDTQIPILEKELYKELNHLTRHLIILLRVADDLEEIFNLVTLGQTVISFIIFASCLFVAANVPVTSPEFFAQVEYFICMLIQLGLFCWFGSGITRASEEIMFALYDSDWFSASRRFKSSLLTTMCRMQRPICLSIGKFCPLTLDAIVGVCKGSFSYYTVFKTVKE